MPPQLVTWRLSQLRAIKESDTKDGSEPYLWVTYFALDGRNIAKAEPLTTDTQPLGTTRQEFPNNVADGQVINVPSFLSDRSFEVDPGPLNFMMAGCVSVLLEEDETPEKAVIAGHIAYGKEIHKQLNALAKKRISAVDKSPIKDSEIKVIHDAVSSKVKGAIKDNLSFGQKLFDNQDDLLGFTYVNFINNDIRSRAFDFPEIFEGNDQASSSNRFRLSGSITLGPIPTEPVEFCIAERAAVKAKVAEIQGLESKKASLQQQLQHASPGAKAGLVAAIRDTIDEITRAEAKLTPLEAALQKCLSSLHVLDHGDLSGGVTKG